MIHVALQQLHLMLLNITKRCRKIDLFDVTYQILYHGYSYMAHSKMCQLTLISGLDAVDLTFVLSVDFLVF